jgi:hypothetical protein
MEYVMLAMELVKLGAEVAPLAQQVLSAVSKPGGPTDADWAALHDIETALRARLAAEPKA